MRKQITVGNLNVIFIGPKSKLDLLDRWNEYIKTVFSDGYSYGSRPQRLLKDVNILFISKNEPVIIGRFVKNTILKVEQVLKNEKLVPRDDSYESAPSSVFMFLLKTHTLIYLPENPGSPSIRSFRNFLEVTINRERKIYINSISKDKSAAEKIKIIDENPPAEVSYIPIPMISTLDEQLNRLNRITKIKVRHFYQNANIDVKSWIKGDDAILNALKAPKIDHTVTKVENIDGVKDFIADLAEASNASFKIDGMSDDGALSISNDGVQYSSYISDYQINEKILLVAENIYEKYCSDRDRGEIPPIKLKNDDEKIAVVFKKNEKR